MGGLDENPALRPLPGGPAAGDPLDRIPERVRALIATRAAELGPEAAQLAAEVALDAAAVLVRRLKGEDVGAALAHLEAQALNLEAAVKVAAARALWDAFEEALDALKAIALGVVEKAAQGAVAGLLVGFARPR